MSRRAGILELARKLGALGLLTALALAMRALMPEREQQITPLLALGLMLLGGDVAADVVERFGLPHLTGYLLAGLLMGPHVLGVVNEPTIKSLGLVNTLALALIALSAGAELTLALLSKGARTLIASILSQLAIVLPGSILAILALRRFIPFFEGLPLVAALGIAMIWGVISTSRSPAATLGVISQLRPQGPLTDYTLSVVVAFDLVVLVLFTLARAAATVMVEPGASFSLGALRELGTSMLGSFACGTTLGLLVAAYLRLVGKQLLVFLIVVAYGATEFTSYFHFEALLLFLTAGFVVANVTHQGERLLEAVAAGGRVVYVIFFALAGAHLDLPLLAKLWPVALALVGARVILTVVAARTGSAFAKDSPPVSTLGWMPLVSQAGITIGMAVAVNAEFPTFGAQLAALTIACVGMNEAVGPVLFKLALDRAGESSKAPLREGAGH